MHGYTLLLRSRFRADSHSIRTRFALIRECRTFSLGFACFAAVSRGVSRMSQSAVHMFRGWFTCSFTLIRSVNV
eukprot:1223654-Prymnesium_polylepis.1